MACGYLDCRTELVQRTFFTYCLSSSETDMTGERNSPTAPFSIIRMRSLISGAEYFAERRS